MNQAEGGPRSGPEQARHLLELLVDLGGNGPFPALLKRSNLPEVHLHRALHYLYVHGYVSCRVRDREITYSVTESGMGVVDLLQGLDA